MNRSLQSLRNYLDKGGERTRWTPSPGVVVVGSGKGGIGTSTVSALLALAGAEDGRQVLLIDGNESVGSLHLLLGKPDTGPGIGDLRGGDLQADDLLQPVAPGFWFLPGSGGGQEATLALGVGERRALFQRVSSLYDSFDLVVIDGGSHLASVQAACATGPERLVAVTCPDRVAMAATYALLKVTVERFPELPVEILVNLHNDPKNEDIFPVISSAGQRFLNVGCAFSGSVPSDLGLRQALEAGTPVWDLNPSLPALEATRIIHGRMAAEQETDISDQATVLTGSF